MNTFQKEIEECERRIAELKKAISSGQVFKCKRCGDEYFKNTFPASYDEKNNICFTCVDEIKVEKEVDKLFEDLMGAVVTEIGFSPFLGEGRLTSLQLTKGKSAYHVYHHSGSLDFEVDADEKMEAKE